MWYLHCFTMQQPREFPVNTYYHESLDVVLETARDVLSRPIAGIKAVCISQSVDQAQAPQRLPDKCQG